MRRGASLRRGLIVATLLLSVSALGPRPAASSFWDEVRSPGGTAYRQALDEGRRALRSRRFGDALEAAERAVRASPSGAEGYVLEARAAAELGDVRRADAALREAIARDPDALASVDDALPIAEAQAALGAYERAALLLERAVARAVAGPLRRRAFAFLGDLHLARGPEFLADALRCYREALRGTNGLDPRPVLGLALALRRAGERAESQEIARSAVRGDWEGLIAGMLLPPSEKAARRALVLESAGDHDGARRAWHESIDGPWRAFVAKELTTGHGDDA